MPLLLLFILLLIANSSLASTPKVLTSIAPLRAIAAAITKDISEPGLLINPNSSPHHVSLRPSQLGTINNADLIIWFGPELETHLAKILNRDTIQTKTLSLLKQKEIYHLAARAAGIWSENDTDDHSQQHRQHPTDPHIWLAPKNALVIARHITRRLADLDPQNTKIYTRNLKMFESNVTHLRERIAAANLEKMPTYLVLHDAFQYFENEFKLPSMGAIIMGEDHSPSPRRIYALRQYIKENNVACLFYEPQMPKRILSSINRGLSLSLLTLDPIGVSEQSYIELIDNLLQRLKQCQLK